jgi:hypothetical protein
MYDVPPAKYLDFCQAEAHGKPFHAPMKGKSPTRQHKPQEERRWHMKKLWRL